MIFILGFVLGMLLIPVIVPIVKKNSFRSKAEFKALRNKVRADIEELKKYKIEIKKDVQ